MRHKHFLIFIRILIFCHDRNIWSRTVTDCLNNSFQKTCGFYYSYFAIQHQKQGYFQIYLDYYYSKLKKKSCSANLSCLFWRISFLKSNSNYIICTSLALVHFISLTLNYPWQLLSCYTSSCSHHSRINHVKSNRDFTPLY